MISARTGENSRVAIILKSAYRIVYAPVFWFGFIGLAIFLIVNLSISFWSLVPLGLLAILTSLISERLIPYNPEWNGYQTDSPRDIAHALVNEFSNIASIVAWGGLAAGIARYFPNAGVWPHNWPLVIQLLIAMVIADAGITFAHYASHKIGFLWRLHAIHHSVARMYGFNGLMKHPLHQTIEGIAGFAPLLVIGVPANVAAILAFAVMVNLLLQHANVDMKLGPLRYVFAFAPVHRFHHLRYGSVGDVNFGFFFNAWDYIMGTSFYSAHYRIHSKDLGVSDRPDFPARYTEQLMDPFKSYTPNPIPAAPSELIAKLE